MCGIFGFALSKPQKLALALKVLTILETHQYPNEEYPVGGHGAGIYFLDTSRREFFVKVGKTSNSPAKLLTERASKTETQTKLLMGHVRRASLEFQDTIRFKECTQPYKAACNEGLKIISVHNGEVENYKELYKKLRLKHYLESEKRRKLVDSEVLPHFIEELLLNEVNLVGALDTLSTLLKKQKGNVVSMLVLEGEKSGNSLVFLHQGSRRGLTIWSNPEREVVFSSRKEPVEQVLGEFLEKSGFREELSIAWRGSRDIKPMIFPLPPNIFAY